MLSIQQFPREPHGAIDRRELMRIGSLAGAGLSLPHLLRAETQDSRVSTQMFGQARNIIFLYLAGGPPQHETFDPKPDAPIELRGPFHPISTNVPGIQICELLPRTAALADRIAIVRSGAESTGLFSNIGKPVAPAAAQAFFQHCAVVAA